MSPGLERQDIFVVVNDYLGVTDAYCDVPFTHRTLSEFLEFRVQMDLSRIPPASSGNRRERLWGALANGTPDEQLRFLEALVEKMDGLGWRPPPRPKVIAMISKLRAGAGVPMPNPRTARQEVGEALATAETLIREHGAATAIDRIHTALHGYLQEQCARFGATLTGGETIVDLTTRLRESAPQFIADSNSYPLSVKVLRAQAKIIDALNSARNDASLAHPNQILERPEAELMVDSVNSLFRYIDGKLST